MKNSGKVSASTERRSLDSKQFPAVLNKKNAARNKQEVSNEQIIQTKWESLLDRVVKKESMPESLKERINAMLLESK